MRNALVLCLFSLAAGAAGVASGCGGDDTSDAADGDPPACADYATVASTPEASFKDDVLPIFQRGCGISPACHSEQNVPSVTGEQRLYLGPPQSAGPADEMQIAEILKQNVGADAVKAPGMKVIAASDVANSFLMHKMDGLCGTDQGLTCTGPGPDGDCGETMPSALGKLLPEAEREPIRRWIAQGAKNN